MATSTTPPDTMLSRKFLSDGVSVTASATSGITSAVATAAAVSPADTFSFMDADARTAILAAAGLALVCSGWNDDAAAASGFLSPATDSGAATAEKDAVAAMAIEDCSWSTRIQELAVCVCVWRWTIGRGWRGEG
ncbi:hypothetical protein PR202_gb21993 [Eleusine coracana subsp. coracana]|uniref:Uncharacterized protein n=1 Tax=Eleusine coracana subsp. coracana TaxID=191504 RepID=A0AAV5FF51_ELECO|nr:hypothetical protein PR202_gb21993 [Eleusine coracana subsp. coracana]